MNSAPNPLPFTASTGYHPPGCWREPGHHGCAIAVLDRLSAQDASIAWDYDESMPIANFIEWAGANLVIPDAPQASLPMKVSA